MDNRVRPRSGTPQRGQALRCGVAGVLLLVSGPLAGAEQIYKWVDDHGRVHYGDKPPSTGQAEQITIKGTSGDELDGADRQQRTERVLEALTTERRERDEARAAERTKRQERKRNCEQAKHTLASYERTNRMFRYDENGEIQYLDESERLAAGDRAREAVRQWCN